MGECNGNTRLVGSQGSTETYPSTTLTCITRLGVRSDAQGRPECCLGRGDVQSMGPTPILPPIRAVPFVFEANAAAAASRRLPVRPGVGPGRRPGHKPGRRKFNTRYIDHAEGSKKTNSGWESYDDFRTSYVLCMER